ncbi:hypothetical protein CTI14_09470 [Methylobacterium radiotolerans]|nr:hypothetical protein CTI14_09470 [Methylobacterium radiotolerans]
MERTEFQKPLARRVSRSAKLHEGRTGFRRVDQVRAWNADHGVLAQVVKQRFDGQRVCRAASGQWVNEQI